MKLPRIRPDSTSNKAFENRKYFGIFDGDDQRMTNTKQKARKKYKKKL